MIHELNLNHDLTIYYLCRVTQTTFVRIIISTNPQKIIFVEIILQLERKIISTNPQKIVFVRILSTAKRPYSHRHNKWEALPAIFLASHKDLCNYWVRRHKSSIVPTLYRLFLLFPDKEQRTQCAKSDRPISGCRPSCFPSLSPSCRFFRFLRKLNVPNRQTLISTANFHCVQETGFGLTY